MLTCTLIMCVACSPIEKNARDAAAALSGLLVTAQNQYATTCVPNPSQDVCVNINKAVSAQNLLVVSIESYCGWQTSVVPPDPTAKCVPNKSATAQLTSAITNANAAIALVKGIVQNAPTPKGGQ